MIKKLSIHHLAEIKDLFVSVFSKPPWNDQWNDEQLNRYLNDLMNQSNSLSFGYYQDDKLIGLSLGYIYHWWSDKEYFIKEFCVDIELQHQGLGSQFLKSIEEELTKMTITAIILNTDSNSHAYHFYMKNEFHELSDYVMLAKNIKKKI